MKSLSAGVQVDTYSEEIHGEINDSLENSETCSSNYEEAIEATQYRDVLILVRFNDRDLPFKLRQIIMSDLRLLTLLEAGLPSWVIFLQSYPGFCHLYRPWMCPLVRALYVLMSVVTVLIGFYDLYKNVPVLKATAFRLCGPLLDWIETWEMVSRIKYLGTMLFLHNFQKAVQWFLTITRATRSFLSIFTKPLALPLLDLFEFLLPIWNALFEVVQSFCSVMGIVIGSFFNIVENLVEILLLPVWLGLSVIWSIGRSSALLNHSFFLSSNYTMQLTRYPLILSALVCAVLQWHPFYILYFGSFGNCFMLQFAWSSLQPVSWLLSGPAHTRCWVKYGSFLVAFSSLLQLLRQQWAHVMVPSGVRFGMIFFPRL